VDHDAWGLKAVAPRIPVRVDEFTNIGKTTLIRARLEMERRFMNNTNDHLTFQDQGMPNGHVELTSCEKGALFLDMRTILEPLTMGNDGWKDAKMQLCKFYVEFYVRCKACERKKKMDELARRATENNGQATVPTPWNQTLRNHM